MRDFQPYWAARGHLCAELEMRDEAREAFVLAMGLSSDAAVRRYLQDRLVQHIPSCHAPTDIVADSAVIRTKMDYAVGWQRFEP